jgi:HSP20 family protein
MTERENRSLAFWDPYSDIDPFPRWPFRGRGRPVLGAEEAWGAGRGGFAPAVDVTESDDSYIVSAELPGTAKDDVTVELHDGLLTIRGEKRSEQRETGAHHRHVERVFGTFTRSFSLPANADGDHIKARFEDGVLEVEIPKREEAKPKTVDIKG